MDSILTPGLIAFLAIVFAIFQTFVMVKVLKMTDDVDEIKKHLKALLDEKKKNETKQPWKNY